MHVAFDKQFLVRFLPWGIALATLAVFSPVLWHDFVNLDDPVVVYENAHVRAGLTLEGIRWAFTSDFVTNWVPLTMVSHMLDVQLFGMNPAGHHLSSVLFHILSSVLLFLTLSRATAAPFCSAAVALLFALHPLQVESVAWIAERKDVLSAFFWMLTLYAYCRYVARPSAGKYLAVLGTFSLGLLAKPMVVTLPVVLLLCDWWPLGRFTSEVGGPHTTWRRNARLLVEKLPFFGLSAGVSFVTYLLKQTGGEIVTDFSLPVRIGRAFVIYGAYIGKMLWPSKLAVFYPVAESAPAGVAVVVSLLLILLLSWLVFKAKIRYPFLLTGWFWYLVALLPVIGIIQSGASTFADRYTYLPLIGIAIIMVWAGRAIVERWSISRPWAGMIAAGVLTGMIFVTSLQLRHWKDSFTLLTHAIEVTDNNWLALNNLGQAYLNKGRVDDAIWFFNESVKAKPSYVIALVNLGALYSMRNEPARAIDVLWRAVQFEPGNEKARLLLGLMYLQVGETELAMAECRALQTLGSLFVPNLLLEISAKKNSMPAQ